MNKAPAFQFYAADFLVDVSEFKSCEIGDYIVLLATQWVNKDLPSDPERLAKIVGKNVSDFIPVWNIIKHKFIKQENGRLMNERIQASRVHKKQISENTSMAGKIGAATRYEKQISEIVFPWNEEDFINCWNKWKQYKKNTFKFTYKTLVSEQTALKKLQSDIKENTGFDTNTHAIAMDWIDNAIANQWQGIYPPKNNKNVTTGAKTKSTYNPQAVNAINEVVNGSNKPG